MTISILSKSLIINPWCLNFQFFDHDFKPIILGLSRFQVAFLIPVEPSLYARLFDQKRPIDIQKLSYRVHCKGLGTPELGGEHSAEHYLQVAVLSANGSSEAVYESSGFFYLNVNCRAKLFYCLNLFLPKKRLIRRDLNFAIILDIPPNLNLMFRHDHRERLLDIKYFVSNAFDSLLIQVVYEELTWFCTPRGVCIYNVFDDLVVGPELQLFEQSC